MNNTKSGLDDDFLLVSSFSSFNKLLAVTRLVLLFVTKLKLKLKTRNSVKFSHLLSGESCVDDAFKLIVRNEQQRLFPRELDYLNEKSRKLNQEIPGQK